MARDRNRKVRKAAMVSVSVAVINKHNPGEFKSIVEINEKVAEIKHYLKEIPGSKFMADRRENSGQELQDPSIYQKKEAILQTYRPLGQILLEENIITSEQLDEALKTHWRRDIRLGETLLELGFISEPGLKQALNLQRELISHLIES